MNRPSFQFYTKDWRANSKLRRCTPAARGVWIDILCALHDSDEYGVARYPLRELANEVGANLAHVRELVEKGVLKGSDGHVDEAFVYVPRSGRKDGPPVTLIDTQPGPLWYSSRMVRDEYVNRHRGESTRFGASKGDRVGDDDGESPNASPTRRQGDGPPSASASAKKEIHPPTPRKRGTVHGFPPGFEAFWSEYPRKQGKEAASKAFARIAPDDALQSRLIAAVRVQRASEDWRKDGGRFVPHASTWLNGKRWLDEVTSDADDVFAGAV